MSEWRAYDILPEPETFCRHGIVADFVVIVAVAIVGVAVIAAFVVLVAAIGPENCRPLVQHRIEPGTAEVDPTPWSQPRPGGGH